MLKPISILVVDGPDTMDSSVRVARDEVSNSQFPIQFVPCPFQEHRCWSSILFSRQIARALAQCENEYVGIWSPWHRVDAEFYQRGKELLIENFDVDFVRGSRRLPDSIFRVSVKELHRAHLRSRLGTLVTVLMRAFFGLQTSDTASLTIIFRKKSLQRYLKIARTRSVFHWLSELQLFLEETKTKFQEIPVKVTLRVEKHRKKLFFEALDFATVLVKLLLKNPRGKYKPAPFNNPGFSADDWGMAKPVNDAILELAKAGLINRVSCMSHGAYLDYRLGELKSLQERTRLGLHLDFGNSLTQILVNFLKSGPENLRKEVRRQYEILVSRGIKVAHLNGHLHVHVFPGIARIVSEEAKDIGIPEVRLPKMSRQYSMKAVFLTSITAWSRRHFRWAYSPNFLYPESKDWSSMSEVLRGTDDLEILIHPATHVDKVLDDRGGKLKENRVKEFRNILAQLNPNL